MGRVSPNFAFFVGEAIADSDFLLTFALPIGRISTSFIGLYAERLDRRGHSRVLRVAWMESLSGRDYAIRIAYGRQGSGNVECEINKNCCNTMNKDQIIKLVNEQMWTKPEAEVPAFQAGDTITVTYRIIEGNKERLQSFRGVVIQIKGTGKTKMFTIRKVSNGVGVERIFPLYSPHIDKIEVNKYGVVRRARIYYLRNLTGKKARIKERRVVVSKEK